MKTNNRIITALAMKSSIALCLVSGLHAATKTLEWGNSLLGAKATGTMSYYTPPTGGSCNFYNTGRVDGSVLFKSINLASGAANFRVNSGSQTTTASGYLKVGRKTLANWNKTIIGSEGFSTDPLLGIEKGGSLDIIPYVFTVGATASVNVRAEGFVYSSPSSSTISGNFGVYADAVVTGSASLDAIAIAGGVEGSVTLCQTSLSASAKMAPSLDPRRPNASTINYSSTFKTRSPHGKMTAWYQWFRRDKHSWDFANFTGTTSTATLASGSFTLNGGTIRK